MKYPDSFVESLKNVKHFFSELRSFMTPRLRGRRVSRD